MFVQVEGAVNDGGRSKCIWDTYTHIDGTPRKLQHEIMYSRSPAEVK